MNGKQYYGVGRDALLSARINLINQGYITHNELPDMVDMYKPSEHARVVIWLNFIDNKVWSKEY